MLDSPWSLQHIYPYPLALRDLLAPSNHLKDEHLNQRKPHPLNPHAPHFQSPCEIPWTFWRLPPHKGNILTNDNQSLSWNVNFVSLWIVTIFQNGNLLSWRLRMVKNCQLPLDPCIHEKIIKVLGGISSTISPQYIDLLPY